MKSFHNPVRLAFLPVHERLWKHSTWNDFLPLLHEPEQSLLSPVPSNHTYTEWPSALLQMRHRKTANWVAGSRGERDESAVCWSSNDIQIVLLEDRIKTFWSTQTTEALMKLFGGNRVRLEGDSIFKIFLIRAGVFKGRSVSDAIQ